MHILKAIDERGMLLEVVTGASKMRMRELCA
jgi:hypothetical protein